ncbi:DEAD/DEAH box helicase [Demequina lutea]|uniref:RNA helicase n=1 Tax=Demequina lutea TaxID=431489 RepID=A0A7Y9Z9I0_9MICO|nr:DEAD/DEAH box helicase [Demequina lutea]NYI40745.1 superfamily II DNA/RNA helicase [Demequina lutea]
MTEQTFADFGVNPLIVEALADHGIISPFPIQSMTLPVALAGHDIIGQAKTGTGKTLGFGVPLLHRAIGPGEHGYDELGEAAGKPQALIMAPTRELAVQVAGDLEMAAKKRSVRIAQIYGGRAYEPQIDSLKKGADVVVGTPGRLIDLMNQGHLDLRFVRTLVLDEADEMLDLGFLPDVEKIVAATPEGRHTMLFSATMPGPIVAMARRYMTQPTHIRASEPDDFGATVKATKQFVYRAHAMDKMEVLARILQANGRGLTIVFARTKRTCAKVSDDLRERGFASGAIHGDLGQGAREQALRAFRSGKIDILVATDVAARGIDVEDVTHVINYQCTEDDKTYVHRIGRTGRAGKTGVAVTFVDWDDMPRWSMINKQLELNYPEPAETYSNSPQLYADMDIPEGTKGTLPRAARVREGLGAEKLEDLGETGKRHAGSDSGRGGRDSGGRGGRDGDRGGRGDGRGSRDGGRGGAPRGDGAGRGDGRGRSAGGHDGAAPAGAQDQARAPREGGATASANGTPRPKRNRNRRRTGGGNAAGGAAGGGQPGAQAPAGD